MKTIADKLLAMPKTRVGELEMARNLLVLPDKNHVAADGDHWRPICDRLVFPKSSTDALVKTHNNLPPQGRRELLAAVRAPAVPSWIEATDWGFAWLIWNGTVNHPSRPPKQSTWATMFLETAKPVVPFGMVDFSDFLTMPDDRNAEMQIFPPAEHLINNGMVTLTEVQLFIGRIFTLLCAISPRVTVIRRKLPFRGNASMKEMLRRRMQRGRPMFSYNVVEMIFPKTADYRGDMQSVEAMGAKRRHLVIGHWRLIDGVIEPFWTWIDGHERGDGDLGIITKLRKILYMPPPPRRGFLPPQRPGLPGEHVKAKRLTYQ